MTFTPTIAIDFDGVIHTYDKGWQDGSIYGDFKPGAIEALTVLMSRYAVFIHTTRDPDQVARWIEDRLDHHIECTTRMTPLLPSWWKWGKKHTFWNTTGTLLVTDRKLPAVAYIDDRAVHFTGWRQAMAELTARGYNAPMLTEDDEETPSPDSTGVRAQAIRAAAQALAKVEPATGSGDAIDPMTRARISVDAVWDLLTGPGVTGPDRVREAIERDRGMRAPDRRILFSEGDEDQ